MDGLPEDAPNSRTKRGGPPDPAAEDSTNLPAQDLGSPEPETDGFAEPVENQYDFPSADTGYGGTDGWPYTRNEYVPLHQRNYTPPGAPAPLYELFESDRYLTPGTDFPVEALVRPVEPRRRTRIKHSIGFYVAVVLALAILGWQPYLYARRHSHPGNPVLFWLGIGVSGFALLVMVLRAVRGSMLDAEDKTRTKLVFRPIPSDRIAKRLHGGEYVLFETKLHPLSILPTILSRLFRSKTRRRLFFGYLVLLLVVWGGHLKNPLAISSGTVTLVVLLVPLFLCLSVYEWSRERYALTNERLLGIKGIVASHVGEMPRARMTDVGVDTPWYSNLLAWARIIRVPFGTWDVETAGQDQRLKLIPGVPSADIVAAMFSLSQRSNVEQQQ